MVLGKVAFGAAAMAALEDLLVGDSVARALERREAFGAVATVLGNSASGDVEVALDDSVKGAAAVTVLDELALVCVSAVAGTIPWQTPNFLLLKTR
mmetsp:Transcript_57961/g.172981  ORF Transcript_57961/g.172981 Transcript_57961/m.172981 type:complete len:96 (-) Transcript_57961:578-865(-)